MILFRDICGGADWDSFGYIFENWNLKAPFFVEMLYYIFMACSFRS
ncbi:MAG: hypothetical protein ACI8V2_003088 [Candidatus Latescibacterota bacterium]|jgi:hypothetical protein